MQLLPIIAIGLPIAHRAFQITKTAATVSAPFIPLAVTFYAGYRVGKSRD